MEKKKKLRIYRTAIEGPAGLCDGIDIIKLNLHRWFYEIIRKNEEEKVDHENESVFFSFFRFLSIFFDEHNGTVDSNFSQQ